MLTPGAALAASWTVARSVTPVPFLDLCAVFCIAWMPCKPVNVRELIGPEFGDASALGHYVRGACDGARLLGPRAESGGVCPSVFARPISGAEHGWPGSRKILTSACKAPSE